MELGGEKMYEPKKTIETYNGYYSPYQKRTKAWRSTNRLWDKIICMICTGCGKPLGRYENLNRLAFCLECREVLFPETVRPRKPYWRNSSY